MGCAVSPRAFSSFCVRLIRFTVTLLLGSQVTLARYFPATSALGFTFSVSRKRILEGLTRNELPQRSFSFPKERKRLSVGLDWIIHSFTKNLASWSLSPFVTPSSHQR